MSTTPGNGAQPPGFYPDNQGTMRWWDGSSFTERTQNSAPQYGGGSVPPPPQTNTPWYKRKLVRVAAAVVAIIAIAAGSSGGGNDDTEDAADDTNTTQPAETEPASKPARTKPAATKPAETKEAEPEPAPAQGALPLEDGDWRLDSVKLEDDGLGSFGGVARITYIGDDDSAVNIFTVTVLDKDGGVIASLDGSAEDMGPGETETVTLISFDDWKPGDYKIFDFQKGL